MRRVGINALFLEPGMGGLEVYVRRLVGEVLELAPELELTMVVNPLGRETLAVEPWADAVRWATPPVLGRRGLRALTELSVLGAWASARVDVLHSAGMTGPLRTRAAHVVVVADTTWLVAPTGGTMALTETLWRTTIPPVARRAARVVAISEAGGRDLVEHLGIPTSKLDVVPLGQGTPPDVEPLGEREVRERFGLGEGPIVLCVGALKVHKNQEVLVRALPTLRRAHPAVRLVLVGSTAERDGVLRDEAQRLGVDEALTIAGFVEPEELEGLYRAAGCFAFPSLNEGFGLPVLEAMARDVPVACSNVSAMPELAGDAALLFDPRDEAAVAEQVGRILGDATLHERLVAAGRERQALFTWRRTAELTLASWRRAAAS
ncbi:glycosyltransferase family 1 protein [Conexibacter sp. SYSU D00693]|uniref:glycosyltransferase family 4 protein n=1 Tax=Conexibacter sp. SYSU D00693 TaxID=2812560 RepID=UPI00196A6CC6|nr:glycosyltransferase family 1 protein [Conexibacter sp. SYSU D00693]